MSFFCARAHTYTHTSRVIALYITTKSSNKKRKFNPRTVELTIIGLGLCIWDVVFMGMEILTGNHCVTSCKAPKYTSLQVIFKRFIVRNSGM